jgi:uncharacterized membrane protein YdjX (TVP38/TMEM64 family)
VTRRAAVHILIIALACAFRGPAADVSSESAFSAQPISAATASTRAPSTAAVDSPAPHEKPERAPRRSAAERATEWLNSMGPWAPLSFIAAMVLLCVLCVPGVFLTIAAGAFFGLPLGFLYAWTGAQLGASASFFISRHVARAWVMRRLAHRPLLSAVEEAVSGEGWKIVFLLRLAPGSPFFLLNYLFGLTRVRYRDYVWATAISSIPGTLTFVYVGAIGHLAVSGRMRTVWDWVLYGIGLAAVAAASWLIARRSREILRNRLNVR